MSLSLKLFFLVVDLRSLFYIFAFENLAILLFFLYYVYKYHDKKTFFRIHACSRALLVIQYILFANQDNIHDFLGVAIANSALIIASFYDVFVVSNAHKKFDKTIFKRYNLLTLLMCVLFSILYLNEEGYRNILISLILSAIYIVGAIQILLDKNKTSIQFIASIVFIIVALIILSRLTYLMFHGINLQLNTNNLTQFITFNLLFFNNIVYTFFLLGIDKEKNERIINNNNAALADLNNNKDLFFKIIAHDLRGPLSGIYRLGEMLWLSNDEKTDEDIEINKELLESLYQSSKTTFNLVDNLLKWAMSNSQTILANKENINLAEIVNENEQLFQTIAQNKSIKLQSRVHGNIGIYADKNMFNTVVRNLLSNAIKFTPQNGTVKISSKKVTNDFVEIEITDSGIGMSQNQLRYLFDIKKKQVRNGTNNESGTGLGLILCQEFLKKNDGSISVSSTEGKGTIFNIRIPAALSC